MILNELHRIILFLGIEDTSGLWEIPWEPQFFDLPSHQRIERARSSLEDLLAHRYVKLYRCQEPDRLPIEEINEEKWSNALSNPEHWKAPGRDSISVRFETTEDGEAAYWETQR
jgi:hypothetical protein